MGLDAAHWDVVWGRKYERYNNHHQTIWEAMLPKMKGKVVDLGCGPCVMYEGKEIDLTGVDWSAEALNQAKLHYPQGVYVQAEAHDSGLPTGSFDTVVALGLLDYFNDWEKIIKEMKRLSNGGAIMATLLNGFRGHNWSAYPKICGNWHMIQF